MQNKKLNMYERKIMKIVLEEEGIFSIRDLAKKSNMSWQTAKKYLERLKERGLLEEV